MKLYKTTKITFELERGMQEGDQYIKQKVATIGLHQ